jgi:16S rRNA processing protein RimM
MLREKAFKVGRVLKTHGVGGQVSVGTIIKIAESEEWPEWIFLDIDVGLVPFRTDQKGMIWRDEKHLILALELYEDPEKAQEIVGVDLWFPNEYKSVLADSKDEISPLVGLILYDQKSGELGRIEELIDLPNNPLFRIDVEGKEVLIPAREEWIISIDQENSKIIMDLPEGLLDIN